MIRKLDLWFRRNNIYVTGVSGGATEKIENKK